MAAINITSREQFGESQYLSKYANQLTELMEPVALQANKDLYSEEYQALSAQAQALVSAKVMTPAEAQRYVNQSFGMYMDPYSKLSRGSTIEKWSMVNSIQNGQINSPAGIMSNLINNTSTALNWANGNSLTASAIQNAYGLNSFRNLNLGNMNKAQEILIDYQTKTPEELEEIYGKTIQNADDYNTNNNKLNKALLNDTTDIGDIKSIITDKGWAIGEVLVGGITAWLGAKIVGGSIGKALGLLGGSGAGGSGAGLLGVLGTGAAVVGLTVATIAGIGSAVNGEYDTISSRTAQENAEQLANSEDPESKKQVTS